MCDNEISNKMSWTEYEGQLIAPNEVKQEPGIKEEPMTTGDLVEFPAIINDDSGQPSRYNGVGDFGNLPQDEVKREVKQEKTCTKKTKKASKCNGRNKDVVANRREQHSLEHAGGNAKKLQKSNGQRNAPKQHQCEQCGYITKYTTSLKKHLPTHSGEKPFKCNECSKQFARNSDLKRHMKTHAGPRSFHCSRCRLGFVQQTKMVAHEQKCSRRVYECHVCGKFIGLDKRNLERHMCTHTGAKPFRCVTCNGRFTRESALNRHINRIHNKKR